MLKPKKLAIATFFALSGAVYFSTFSQLEISPFVKGYIAIIPFQGMALLYVFYLHWSDRLHPNPSSDKGKTYTLNG